MGGVGAVIDFAVRKVDSGYFLSTAHRDSGCCRYVESLWTQGCRSELSHPLATHEFGFIGYRDG